jgi:hypothetical protein
LGFPPSRERSANAACELERLLLREPALEPKG